MANIKFFYNNLWNDETLVSSSEHANFPAENTQLRDFNEPWRSRYGASTGWGLFVITASVNDRIDFDEGGGELNANLTAGVYSADTLAAHLKTIMDAAGAHTYTWSYVEAGADANKFKCVDGTGNVIFPWKTGTNGADGTGRTVGDTIGFLETGDDGAAATHTADNIRIHTYENLYFLRASTIDVDGCIIKGHNIQAGATVSLLGSDDNLATATLDDDFTVQDDIMILEYDTSETYQDWAVRIFDVDNSDTYVEMGVVFLGPQFQPTINYLSKSRVTKSVDPSIIKRSEAGQISTIQLDDYEVWQYAFRVSGSTQKGYFDTMLAAVKKSLPLFICEDPDSPLTTTYYCQFVDWEWTPVYEVSDVWDLTLQVEELI